MCQRMPFWCLLLPLLLALLGVTACSPFPGPPGTLHATPLAAAFPARIVLPPCLAGDGLPDAAQGFTPDIPKNMGRLLGFELYVPTGLPADVTWNGAVFFTRAWRGGGVITPLFHAAYGVWVTRPYNAYGLEDVVALDETTSELSPTAHVAIGAQSPRLARQTPVSVAGKPGVFFELQASPAYVPPTQVIGLLWKDGAVTLRLTAVTVGSYAFAASDGVVFDQVQAWRAANEHALVDIASSIGRYAGCG